MGLGVQPKTPRSPVPAARAWRVGPGGRVSEHGGLVRDAGQAGAGQEAAQLAQRQAAQRRRQPREQQLHHRPARRCPIGARGSAGRPAEQST
jgi:hypothetical protein